jgi:hypothetical protein
MLILILGNARTEKPCAGNAFLHFATHEFSKWVGDRLSYYNISLQFSAWVLTPIGTASD